MSRTSRRRGRQRSRWEKFKRLVLDKAPWIGAALAVLSYAAVFAGVAMLYVYVVSPLTLRWKARYGQVPVPAGYSIHGIDVSHHQGRIDWEKLGSATIGGEPIAFVFVKATEGYTHVDSNFERNFRGAQEVGLMRGAYHYFVPGVAAEKQAEHFVNHVKLEEGDLPPVLDIEEAGNLTVAQVQHDAALWLRLVEKHYGVRPIIYTGYKFKLTYLNTPAFGKYPYWIAHYYVQKLKYGGTWKFWQHTDVGTLPGITGSVDFNVYNGSMYDLRKMAVAAEE